MGTAWLDDIVARVLAAGRDPATPAAAIERGTTPHQRVVVARLQDLPERVAAAQLQAPTVIVIGHVVQFRERACWFERLPLFGKRVLVARAEQQAGGLVLELRRRAAEPVVVPLLEVLPGRAPEALAAALERASDYHWLVYTSANALRFAAPRADALGRARLACIGSATARAARALGLPVELVPEGESTPERLAQALAAHGALAGKRVLFPRAEKAREALVRELERLGAHVDAFEAYRTRLPEDAPAQLATALDAGIDAVAFTSPSTVEHFFALLDVAQARELLARVRFVCVGPTTAAALEAALGGREARACVAERQDMEALVAALERDYAEDRDGLS
jgi:uroporphyrinogen III methyltransferase/synthase